MKTHNNVFWPIFPFFLCWKNFLFTLITSYHRWLSNQFPESHHITFVCWKYPISVTISVIYKDKYITLRKQINIFSKGRYAQFSENGHVSFWRTTWLFYRNTFWLIWSSHYEVHPLVLNQCNYTSSISQLTLEKSSVRFLEAKGNFARKLAKVLFLNKRIISKNEKNIYVMSKSCTSRYTTNTLVSGWI